MKVYIVYYGDDLHSAWSSEYDAKKAAAELGFEVFDLIVNQYKAQLDSPIRLYKVGLNLKDGGGITIYKSRLGHDFVPSAFSAYSGSRGWADVVADSECLAIAKVEQMRLDYIRDNPASPEVLAL